MPRSGQAWPSIGAGGRPWRAAHRTVLLTLGVLTVAALIGRIPSIAEPLGIDQGLFASAARGLARGQMLYRDLWDHKPPGVFLTYWLAFSVLGWTSSSIAWLDLAATTATTVLLFAIVRRLGGLSMATLTAALYATLTMPSWLYGHGGFLERSVAETFIVLCIAASAWAAIRATLRPGAPWAFGVGFFAGAAVMYKPNAGLYLPAMLLWFSIYRRRDRSDPGDRRQLVRALVVSVLGSLVVPIVVGTWLWYRHALSDAWVALVRFNLAYVSEGVTMQELLLAYAKAVWLRMKTDPLWLAGGLVGPIVVGWEALRVRRLDPAAALGVLWGGGAALVIFTNGVHLFNTYFVQALPPLAILAAWVLTAAARRSRMHRAVAVATVGLMALLLVRNHYWAKVSRFAVADFAQLRGRSDRVAYLEIFGGYANNRGYSARANEELYAYVGAHTRPTDAIYLFGISGAGVYFATDRPTAHRFPRANMFVPATFPDAAFQLDDVIQKITSSRPLYVIFERLHSVTAMGRAVDRLEEAPAVVELLKSYRKETQIEDFALYRRVD